jgi:hypothetical protein
VFILALFWKLLPENTLAFKNEKAAGGKKSKDRVTVLVGASMTGEKLPLFVIGRREKPRCFRSVTKLPVRYKANRKSWMTGALFEEWLRSVDVSMRQQGRKIAIVLDNCPAHPACTDLQNIELIFLPANTTSKTQSMDGGVIKTLKQRYRRKNTY